MKEAIGLIEVIGLSTAILVADTMVKSASIDINDVEITKGFGYVTVKVSGNVAAVTASLSAGKNLAMSHDKYISSKVIARPLDTTYDVFFKDEKNSSEQTEKVNVIEEKDDKLEVQAKSESLKTKNKKTRSKNVKAENNLPKEDVDNSKIEAVKEIPNKDDLNKEISETAKK